MTHILVTVGQKKTVLAQLHSYNRHWIIRYVREKTFPRSSESNLESRSVTLTRFRGILVAPYDMVYVAYVLVLSASWYWITVWHDIIKYLACARVQQAWRDELPGGTRLMSSKQTNCPYKIMFVLNYYINRNLAFPLLFIKNKSFWKEQATFQTQTLWKEIRKLNKITSTTAPQTRRLCQMQLGHAAKKTTTKQIKK